MYCHRRWHHSNWYNVVMKASGSGKPHPRDRESLLALDKEALVDRLLSLEVKYDQLADYVRDLVTQKYGKKNDRFEAPGQLLVFPGATADGGTTEPQAAATGDSGSTPVEKKPKKPGHGRKPIPEHLPRVPIDAQLSDEAQRCPACDALRVAVRKILRNSRYGCVPASFFVEDLYAVVYECPNGHGEQLIAEVDEAVPNGKAAPSLMAQVAVSKDVDHMPFNRQVGMYARSGVPLNRSTLSDTYAQLAVILMPLYLLMKKILLQSRIISTDDTPVKVLDRSKDKNIKTGRKWAYLGDKEHPVNLFDYTEGRGRDGPQSFLEGWKGILQGDCFSGNLALCAAIGTVLVACLAHARRYFIKAMFNNKEGCNQALVMFQALYEIERTAKDLELSTDEIRTMREQEAVPLLNKFHGWLQQQYAVAQPKSSFGKALFYCLNNWTELKQYVTDGDLKIDNNHTEREMKYVSMGKKAWLFYGSDEGGKNNAIVSSVISTCRRHGVEPWDYLTDVVQRLTENPDTNLEELLPYNWTPRSEVEKPAEIPVSKNAPKAISA
jgi:transposase